MRRLCPFWVVSRVLYSLLFLETTILQDLSYILGESWKNNRFQTFPTSCLSYHLSLLIFYFSMFFPATSSLFTKPWLPIAIALQFFGQSSVCDINQYDGALILFLWSTFLFVICLTGRNYAIRINNKVWRKTYFFLAVINFMALCLYTLAIMIASSPAVTTN
jgi:hypothetical protein